MLKYVVRRILLFIPTLVAISLLAFIISSSAPGDPVERLVTAPQTTGDVVAQSSSLITQKKIWRKKLGLDLPLFYFSISSLAAPDTMHKFYDNHERDVLERLTSRYGNWEKISDYYLSLVNLEKVVRDVRIDRIDSSDYQENKVKEMLSTVTFEVLSLRNTSDDNVITAKLNLIYQMFRNYAFLKKPIIALNDVQKKYNNVVDKRTPWKTYIPCMNFYANNRYHRWIFGDGNWLTGQGSEFTSGIVRGDFGLSYQTKQPVSEKIGEKIFWSVLLTVISVLIAYSISIPIGIRAAVRKDSAFDRWSSVTLFILYSMPSFWVAILLMMIFANPGIFADGVPLLPASGVKPVTGYPDGAGLWEKISLSIPYLILPTICYTYGSFAFLSRVMRVSMLEVVGQDYIRTAKAKGLTEAKVIYKHGLRNALLPIITVFANIFPVAIGGSVIIEYIFTIPGMGYEILQAIYNQDYPMLIAVFVLTGALTMAGFLISDVLYAIVDPRISFAKK